MMHTSELQLDRTAIAYATRAGDACARSVWSINHLILLALLGDVALYFALCGVLELYTVIILTLSFSMALAISFRLFVIILSIIRNPIVRVNHQECLDVQQTDLPIYTILVPLYREANVAGTVIRALSRLEYPRDRLDIKLLLEADDQLTTDAVNALTLGSEYDVILVPPSYPRTKPKACNYGLPRARGEFVVIFDAEDQPDPDQLLKAVHVFRNASPYVICLQAKLHYFNARENFLTRCFELEYTTWFESVLPGLQYLDAPIPLGGTSNHFRRIPLEELGGWDPFNVTEDCDLGIRVSLAKYRTLLIDSITWEEANSEVTNWIRQRSRWIKGYLQTFLVHTKHPRLLLKSLGMKKTCYFIFAVGGVAVTYLLNIVLWLMTLAYATLLACDFAEGRQLWTVIAGSRDEYRVAWKMLFLGPGEDPFWSSISVVAFCASIAMFAANAIFILINLLACRQRGFKDLWWAAILSPFYWTLGSIAAWKGAIQLIHRPHFWEKTIHGLSKVSSQVDRPTEKQRDNETDRTETNSQEERISEVFCN